MKVTHYQQMMAYLTRPGYDKGGKVLPKKKPQEEIKRRSRINYEKLKKYLDPESQMFIEKELGFAIGGSVETPKRGLVDEPGSYAGERTRDALLKMRTDGMTIPEIARKYKVSVKTINNDLKKFNLLGMQTFMEPMTERRAEEIRRTLPDGVKLRREKSPRTRAGYSYRLEAKITQGGKYLYNKSFMNPTEDQIKIITEGYTKAFKEANPGYISPKEFEELRFKKANVRLTDREFAEVLNAQGKTTKSFEGKKNVSFTKKSVANFQKKLNISDQVGKEIKPLSKDLQNRLINNFPEITNWDFDSYKYGVSPTEYGQDVWSTLRHSSMDKKRWNPGKSPKSRLWHNAFRSAIKNKGQNRYRLLNDKGEIMTRAEVMDTNWSTKSKQAKFLDTSTGREFTYDTFEDYLNNYAGPKDPNRFKNAASKYKLSEDLYNLNVKGPDGNQIKLGTLLDQQYKGDKKIFKALHNHHNFDIAENFWDTDVVFYKDNLKIAPLEKNLYQELKDAAKLPEEQKTKVLKNLSLQLDNFGPIRLTVPGAEIGKYDVQSFIKNIAKQAGLPEQATNLVKAVEELPSETQGAICNALKKGGLSIDCADAIKKNPFKTSAIIAEKTRTLPDSASVRAFNAATKLVKDLPQILARAGRFGLGAATLGASELALEGAYQFPGFQRGESIEDLKDKSILGLYGIGQDLERKKLEKEVAVTGQTGALEYYDYLKDSTRINEIDAILNTSGPDEDVSDLLVEKEELQKNLITPTEEQAEQFQNMNLRMVGQVAARRKARGFSPTDLIEEGPSAQDFMTVNKPLSLELGGIFDPMIEQFEAGQVPRSQGAAQRRRLGRNPEIERLYQQSIQRANQNIMFPVEGTFAGGGIAKLAGVDSGPAPKSGPTPDGPSKGLAYLFKNGMEEQE